MTQSAVRRVAILLLEVDPVLTSYFFALASRLLCCARREIWTGAPPVAKHQKYRFQSRARVLPYRMAAIVSMRPQPLE